MTDRSAWGPPPPGEVYRDFGDPLVERLARAISESRRAPPDNLIPESGYSNAAMIPRWWMFQDEALHFLACRAALEGKTYVVGQPESVDHD